jgi:hypothetical protein
MSVIATPSLYFLVYRNHILEAHHGIAKDETLANVKAAGGAKATVATFLAPMELFVSIFVLQHAATSYIYFICAMPAKYRNTDHQLGIIPDSESNCKVLSTAVLGYQYNQPEHRQRDWVGEWNHHGVALSLLFLWSVGCSTHLHYYQTTFGGDFKSWALQVLGWGSHIKPVWKKKGMNPSLSAIVVSYVIVFHAGLEYIYLSILQHNILDVVCGMLMCAMTVLVASYRDETYGYIAQCFENDQKLNDGRH